MLYKHLNVALWCHIDLTLLRHQTGYVSAVPGMTASGSALLDGLRFSRIAVG